MRESLVLAAVLTMQGTWLVEKRQEKGHVEPGNEEGAERTDRDHARYETMPDI